VLLVVLPLKGRLVRHLFRTPQGWEARASAVVSLVALTVATLRFVFARPSWPARPVPARRGARDRCARERGQGCGEGAPMTNDQGEELDRPNAARIYDYLLGGAQNFTVDRAAAEHVLDNYPDAALAARSNRAFLRRAVAYLAGQGIAQFLDIGSGLPTVGNVHEVARQVNPRARIVYVDNDPVAVRYSRELLAEEGEGARGVAAIEADLRDPAAILAHPRARRLLDLSRPVALILAAVLHFIPDDDAALGAVRDLAAALPVGSYLVISHGTYDGASSETLAQLARLYEATTHPLGFRSHAQLARFFDGFEVIAPGIVFAPAWRPDGSPSPFTAEPERAAVLAGVGRKL